MIVVSDTSCISNLLTVEHTHLLAQLFGEAQAICLARELKADRLLMDEKRGRAAALREHLPVIGVVGVLVVAKQKGMLPSVAELLKRLENEAGFRLSQHVKAAALQAVGESET